LVSFERLPYIRAVILEVVGRIANIASKAFLSRKSKFLYTVSSAVAELATLVASYPSRAGETRVISAVAELASCLSAIGGYVPNCAAEDTHVSGTIG
jgi:hypothetical protein